MSTPSLSLRPPLRLTRHRTAAVARPRWERPALFTVLALAAALCLWDLTANGYSNEYYAAAAKSASESWKAWFFGSLDPGSFITVDKPPLSLWLMGLSARILGYSSFSILLPQALCTIGAVALLYATVRRATGSAAAAVVAAAALATTPVTVAIGRVNNPDALLVLLLVASAWFTVRAVESGRTKHLALAGAVVGLAFMTKMLQGWMVVPALAVVYAYAGPHTLLRRVRQLLAAGVAMVAVSAAWPVAVSLWPGSKPYIGGSTDGTVWDLILGYNGFGRITGGSAGQGASFGGVPGLLRMFNEQVGGQVAWLLPLAAVGLVAGLVLTRRAPRTDAHRAGFVLFGVWAIVLVVVFSAQQGTFHPYYVSALAPAVAALAGMGAVALARAARTSLEAHIILAGAVAGTAALAVQLLGRTADFAPWLRTAVPVAAAVAIAASLVARWVGGRRLLAVAAVAAVVAVAAGPTAYSVATAGRSLSGNDVLAGPASVSSGGMGGRMGGGSAPSGTRPSLPSGATAQAPSASGSAPAAQAGGGESASAELIAYLKQNQGSAKYLVAATGSQTTAAIIIATGEPVVTIGGFNGSDPAPTVAELEQMVADGELKYVLVGSGGGGRGGSSSSDLATWVQEHGEAVTSVSTTNGTLYEVSAT